MAASGQPIAEDPTKKRIRATVPSITPQLMSATLTRRLLPGRAEAGAGSAGASVKRHLGGTMDRVVQVPGDLRQV